jgi:hypothetical protein
MINYWKFFGLATICSIAAGQVWAEAARVATLDIEWENAVVYIDDVADPSKFVTSSNPVTPGTRNFMTFIAIGVAEARGEPYVAPPAEPVVTSKVTLALLRGSQRSGLRVSTTW